MAGEFACIADGDALRLYPAQCAAPASVAAGSRPECATAVLTAWPNPIVTEATFRFDLPRASRAEIRIYDVAGRCVRRLEGGARRAGGHQLTWDGRSHRGRLLPSGIYLARLLWDGGHSTDGLVLQR